MKQIQDSMGTYVDELREKVINSIKKELGKLNNNQKIGVLFSGGVDSTLIAYCLKKSGVKFQCYTAALEGEKLSAAKDLESAREVAAIYDFPLEIAIADLEKLEEIVKEVMQIIKSDNVVKVGVAIPLYLAMQRAAMQGYNVVFSGIGSEEIFAGYERHAKAQDINEECRSGLENMKERDLDRDSAIAKHLGVELKAPLLDPELVDFALKIPGEYKINNEQNKLIFRQAAESIGLDKETAMRKKRGAQYGSGFDKGLTKLAKKKGFKYKSDYLRSL